MVELERLSAEDQTVVLDLLTKHHKYTRSQTAEKILDNFHSAVKSFVKVMPLEYKRILGSKQLGEKLDLAEVSEG